MELLRRSVSEVVLGLVSGVIKGMNGLREMLCILLWHSLSFSWAILHTSQELWARSLIVLRGRFPQEATLCAPARHPRQLERACRARSMAARARRLGAEQFFSWVVSELIAFLPHNQLAFPNSQFGDLSHHCPPIPICRKQSWAHFQPDFLRSAKHMQSCHISLSSAHSPATSDTANRFQPDLTERQRSLRQSESINFMGTDCQTEERHY